MIAAKYYIYRNLRTGGFSVRRFGKVIDRLHKFTAINVKFKVNEISRQRVIQEGQKNVHAFVVADKYKGLINKGCELDKLSKITYNPYTNLKFMCDGKEIETAEEVIFQEGRCFLVK